MFGLVVTWIHVAAAMFWIGGMLFFSIIVIPSLNNNISREIRKDLIRRLGRRFRVLGWIAFVMIFITGMIRFSHMGLSLEGSGDALKIKLILVFLMVLLTLLHDFILRLKSYAPFGMALGPNTGLKIVRFMARLNLLVGLLIVLAAVFFVRGF